jgi:hypothetical protein
MEIASGAKVFQKDKPKTPPSGFGDAQDRTVGGCGPVAVAGLLLGAILTGPKLGSFGSRQMPCSLLSSTVRQRSMGGPPATADIRAAK